jgi:hypothetical protein
MYDLFISETLPPEMGRKDALCMNQYRYLFGITRVPKPGCDVNVGSHPAHSKHIIVAVRNQFYVVPVIDPSGARVSIDAIAKYVPSIFYFLCRLSSPLLLYFFFEYASLTDFLHLGNLI